MPIYSDGEAGSSVRAKINAAITAADKIELQGGDQVGTYNLRSEFIAAAPGLTVDNGGIVTASGVKYMADSTATDISDLPGWLPFGDKWYIDHFAENTTPGTTDLSAALTDALLAGRDIYHLATSYRYARASGFYTLTNQRLIGAGAGQTTVTFEGTSGSFMNFFRAGDRSGFIGMKIVIEGAGTETIDLISPRGDFGVFKDCEFDGGMTGGNWEANLFHLADTTNAHSWTVRDNNVHDYKWAFLKDNSDTSNNNYWVVTGNTFKDMWAPATVNTPNGDAIGWVFDSNTFDTNNDGGGFGHLSGCAGGYGFKFVHNTFLGACNYALHFEESDKLVASNNVANLVNGGFIIMLENGAGGVPNKPNDECVITGNVIQGDTSTGFHGILVNSDGGGPSARRTVITGNVIRGFDRGISWGTNVGSISVPVISNNSVFECNTGIQGASMTRNIKDNVIGSCPIGLKSFEGGGRVGKNTFIDCALPLSTDANALMADGIVLEFDEFSLPTGDQNIDLMPLPAQFNARIGVSADFGSTNHQYCSYDAIWDGSTATGFAAAVIVEGSGSVGSPNLAQDGVSLQANYNNTSGSAKDTRLSVDITGTIIIT